MIAQHKIAWKTKLFESSEQVTDYFCDKWEFSPYFRTVVTTVALLGGELIVIPTVHAFANTVGIPLEFGADNKIKIEYADWSWLFLLGVWFGPTVEESIFRGLPSFALDVYSGDDHELDTRPLCWPLGIGTAIIFGLAHGAGTSGGVYFVPLPQIIGGTFYWYLTRRRGLEHAVLAHSLHNLILLLTVATILEFYHL